jgi:hypothetical protein
MMLRSTAKSAPPSDIGHFAAPFGSMATPAPGNNKRAAARFLLPAELRVHVVADCHAKSEAG